MKPLVNSLFESMPLKGESMITNNIATEEELKEPRNSIHVTDITLDLP